MPLLCWDANDSVIACFQGAYAAVIGFGTVDLPLAACVGACPATVEIGGTVSVGACPACGGPGDGDLEDSRRGIEEFLEAGR